MIETKLFEVRDAGTFIPVAAFLCMSKCVYANVLGRMTRLENEAEDWLFRRAGYQPPTHVVFVCKLAQGGGEYDPYEWQEGRARTMQVAHLHIQNNWPNLTSGDVICVETIVGERTIPKVSERLER